MAPIPTGACDVPQVPVERKIFHLAHRSEWEAGHYETSTRGVTLQEEGFTHCAFVDQLAGVAERFYADDPEELVVLEIDLDKLAAAQAELRIEEAPGTAERFPHIYGPIPPAAVVRVRPARFDESGTFHVDL
ncbi:uncharacterized protein (DUF952 family) [Antricoccus suffuscus]|uniref:Uncharacterized protein (DUF952 family) n=1 Tax=Antricoccus suffuscus TaxID=1629062 RepID=A0A2T1A2B1_9ACTN|nr:DUF952 domain-containing protein [Antricoccus suffuscus]PRZ42750.1 uncharacterized protein (DUF952 family) [Antricoccus suffuscus]